MVEVTEQAATPTRILDLPPEILLQVLSTLDISDILNVRLTSSTLFKITFERSIWMAKLQEQAEYLPLPPDLNKVYLHEDKHLREYSASTIETLVTKADRSSDAWIRSRRAPYKIIRQDRGTALIGLKMFSDRWLMSCYLEGAIYLYDTQPMQRLAPPSILNIGSTCYPELRASLFVDSGPSFAATLDSTGQRLFIGLSRSVPPYVIQIYEINLLDLSSSSVFLPHAFQFVKQIHLQGYKTIQTLDPSTRLVAVSAPGLVELLKWDQNNDDIEEVNKLANISIPANPEDLDLWNGVIAVHFMESYLLIFKTRSLEIHKQGSRTYSSNASRHSPLKHSFSMTFRDVSFSHCTISRDPVLETEIYETTLFAYDVIQGLFHYTVRVKKNPSHSELPPSLEVIPTDVYPLAVGLMSTAMFVPLSSRVDSPIRAILPSPPVTYSANFTPSYNTSSQGNSQTATNLRGFLSTHSVGAQGKRAIWIERKRSSTAREVLVWSRDSPSSIAAREKEVFRGADGVMPPMEIERKLVFSVNSYDLRDDITCCAFSEINGTIILGHRSGDISILEPNYSQEPVGQDSQERN